MKTITKLFTSAMSKKNRKNTKCLLFVIASFSLFFSLASFAFFVPKAHAAVGINKQINFQGKLVDNNGLNVADSTYTVVFSLYSVSSGGAAVWTESDSVTTTAGIFQVALGAVTTFPGNVDFNSDSLYLGIKVGSDAEMTPRVRFTAVPYAFNADKVDGVVATQSATGFNLQGGTSSQSTVAFTTAASVLTFTPGVAEGLTIQSNGANPVTLDTGSAGTAAVNIGTGTATSVSIGTSTNTTTVNGGLTVVSGKTFTFNSDAFTDLTGNGLTLSSNALTLLLTTSGNTANTSSNSGLELSASGLRLLGGCNTGQVLSYNNSTSVWACTNSSSLGTNYWQLNSGALAPFSTTADLLVGGTSTTSADFAVTGMTTTTPVASIAAITGTKNGIALDASTATMQSLNKNTLTLGGATTGDISFKPGNATSLYLASGGNVGIGTTSPSSILGISGQAAQTIKLERNTTSNTAGNNLTLAAGGATTGATDKNGGTLFISGGTSTGGGSSQIQFQTAYATGGLGTVTLGGAGSGYTNGTLTLNVTGGSGSGGTVSVTVSGGSVASINSISAAGSGYHVASFATTTPASGGGTGATINITAVTGTNDNTPTTYMTILGNGNIGFGTTNPVGQYIFQTVTGPLFGPDNFQVINAGSSEAIGYSDLVNRTTIRGGSGFWGTAALEVYPADIFSQGLKVVGVATAGMTADLLHIQNSDNSLQYLDVSPVGTNITAAIVGQTSAAALAVNNTGVGDLFTASASGVNRFVITNGGNVGIGTNLPGARLDITGAGTGHELIGDPGLASNYTGESLNGTLNSTNYNFLSSPTDTNLYINRPSANDIVFRAANSTQAVLTSAGYFGVGVASSLLGTLDVRGQSGTLPIASVSGNTSFAGLVVDNKGAGDLLTASSSGLTRFQMTNNGTTVFEGDSLTSIGTGGTKTTSGAVVNAMGDQGSLIPNAGFESAVTGVGFADGWAVAATASAGVTRIATDSAKGTSSVFVKLNANETTAIYSTCVPLAGQSNGNAGKYNLNYYIKGSSTTNIAIGGWLDGYTTKNNCETEGGTISRVLANVAPPGSTTLWVTKGSGTTALANFGTTSTWAKVHFIITCNGSCSAGTTAEIDGVRLIENTLGLGVDYAENYPADPHDIPQPGDVVSLVASEGASLVAKTKKAMDQSVIGVVSTNPGEVLDDGSMGDAKATIALAGRIPVKVSTSNGAIHIGDYLTSSTIPGVAVKATGPGPVIGTAMSEDTDTDPSSVGQVTMFIKNTYYNGSSSNDSGLALATGGDASVLLNLFGDNASGSAVTSGQNASLSATIATGLMDNGGVATISGDLRVKGNALFEGILHVADTLFANNFIVNGVSDFFGTVIFHNTVSFEKTPVFTGDTGGVAIIKKGADHVDVVFSKAYDQTPIVNASITVDPLTPTPGETSAQQQQRESSLEQAVLGDSIHYVISKRTANGFTIQLDKLASEELRFSWMALLVKNATVFQSDGKNPTITIAPTEAATPSAGF